MKKILLLSLTAVLFIPMLSAQVTLTYAIHGVNVGDVSHMYYVDTTGVLPGPSGTNQTWSFGNSILNSIPTTTNYVNPLSTTYSSTFHSSNIAVDDGSGYIDYYSSTSSSLTYDGVGSSNDIIPFSDPETVEEYPFTYTNTFTDTYYSAYFRNTYPYVCKGTTTLTADGTGTLVLPIGSFPVLRTKWTEQFEDSGQFSDVTYNYLVYEWYSATEKFPLMTLVIIGDTLGQTSKYVQVNADVVGIREKDFSSFNINIFPNPVTENANLNFTIIETQKINISVSDLEGKTILNINRGELSPGEYSETINVTSLSKGIYFVKVQGEKSFACKKLIVE
jgi:hypothetical protein